MRQAWDQGGPSRQYARLRTLAVVGTIIFALAMSATLVWFQIRSENAVHEAILTQARAHAQEFNAVRTYVQGVSGIYVPASKELTVNPHLEGIPGVTPMIAAPDGKKYVLQNAPCVARAVSDILKRDSDDLVQMQLTSVQPINPGNAADAFTRQAIAKLNTGSKEVFAFSHSGDTPTFSYALGIPLAEKCSRCHPSWAGLNNGNAGATVVRLDVSKPLSYVATSRRWTGSVVVALLLASAGLLHILLTRVLRPMHEAQLQIYDMARHDSLTGLALRHIGLEALAEEVARASREDSCLTCCMIDVDDFKKVNDERGHSVGDSVLATVGEAIRSCLRPYDTAARVGGEEFLLLLPGACAREADTIVRRVRAAIADSTASMGGLGYPVTCSVGMAVFDPPSAETAHELYVRADNALLAAKRAGKDRSMVSGDALLRSASVLRTSCPAAHIEPEAL